MTYGTSSIKRQRRTKAELERLKTALASLVMEHAPCTVRQTYYRAVVGDLIPKTQQAYQGVCRLLVELRREGVISYDAIADNTRWVRKPRTWDSLDDALDNTVSTYRRALWSNQNAYVEIWCESDSIAGVLLSVTHQFDVPLHALRGFGSESYLHAVASTLWGETRPVHIYYCGDYDPSGVFIDRDAERKLREFAPDVDIVFQRIAVTPAQISEWKLPGKPAKSSDSRARAFAGREAVEIESIQPSTLRQLVEDCIVQHIDPDAMEALERTEAAERETLRHVRDALRTA